MNKYPTFQDATKINDTADGFVAGALAGVNNIANIFAPKIIGGHIQPQGVMAGLGEGFASLPAVAVGAGVSALTGGLDIPIVATIAGAGAFGGAHYVTDYLSQKASDEAYEFNLQDMMGEVATNAAFGGLIHGGVKGLVALKKSIFKPTDLADSAMSNSHVIDATNDLNAGRIGGDDYNVETPKPSIKANTMSNAINEYKASLSDKDLKARNETIDQAGMLLGDGTVEDLAQQYNRNTSSTSSWMMKNLLADKITPELKAYINEPANGRELFKALRGQSDDPTAMEVGKIANDMNSYIVDNVNKYIPMTKMENYDGKQIWNPQAIREAFQTDEGTQRFLDTLQKAKTYTIDEAGNKIDNININNIKSIFEPIVNKDIAFAKLSNKGIYQRKIIMSDGDGAYDVHQLYMNSPVMPDLLSRMANDGAERIVHARMFKDNFTGIVNELNKINDYQYGDKVNKPNINYLLDAVNPSVPTAQALQTTMVDAFNAVAASARAIKSVTQPMWNSIFGASDVTAAIAKSYAKYGMRSLKESINIAPHMGEYSHLLSPFHEAKFKDTISTIRDIFRKDTLSIANKIHNSAMLIDSKLNGSHMIDGAVRRVAFAINQHGVNYKLENELSKEIYGLATANGKNVIPSAKVLRDMATELNKSKVMPIKDEINKNIGLVKTIKENIATHKETALKMQKELREYRKQIAKLNSEQKASGSKLTKMGKMVSNKEDLAMEDIQSLLEAKANRFDNAQANFDEITSKINDLLNERDYRGLNESLKKDLVEAKAELKSASDDLAKFKGQEYTVRQAKAIAKKYQGGSNKFKKTIQSPNEIKINNLKIKANALNDEYRTMLSKMLDSREEILSRYDDIQSYAKEMEPHIARVQELDKAGARIEDAIAEGLNDINPLTYHTGTDIKRGDLMHLMPLRMARWVINTWVKVNYDMAKGAYNGMRQNNWGAAYRNMVGLAAYGSAVGTIDTFLTSLLTGKKVDGEEYAKNIGLATLGGGMYLIGMHNPVTTNPIFKLGKESLKDDPQYHKAFGLYGAIINSINSDGGFIR